MFKSKSNLKHFINLLNFFLKNYFFCRKSISEPADGPWLKSIFFYSNGFLFWLRKKIMEHLSVLADIYIKNCYAHLLPLSRLSLCLPRARAHWALLLLSGLRLSLSRLRLARVCVWSVPRRPDVTSHYTPCPLVAPRYISHG